MNKRTRLVCGIGENDADYAVQVSVNVGGKEKLAWMCPLYQTWKNMLMRCYSIKYQAKHPTYAGCSVTPEWLWFSRFREWMLTQPWEGNQLDKDILRPGNKVYRPEACVFVSTALNNFMIDRGADRGDWPIGVHWHKQKGKFQAQCRNPFTKKGESVGYFHSQEAAHEAWRERKHDHALRYADMQKDPRIAEALRQRYRNAN